MAREGCWAAPRLSLPRKKIEEDRREKREKRKKNMDNFSPKYFRNLN